MLAIGCAKPAPVLVRPKIDMPERPERLPVEWTCREKINDACVTYCTNTQGARNVAKNEDSAAAHIEVLEGYIRAVGGGAK